MRTVEQIVEQVRAAAGADFAFVLTRKGRLVTHRAPRDMPEVGRARLARAARPLVGTDRVIEVTLPREELVPYGGAAPIDVFIGVVAEQAIVCVVMASWADKLRVVPAMDPGMRAIAPLLRRGLPSPRRAADVEPAKGSPYVPERASAPPPPLESSPPLVDLRASLIPEVPHIPRLRSLPEISIAESTLGRESLIAVRRDGAAGGSAPEITVSELHLGRDSLVAIRMEEIASGPAPEITLSEAPLGRESLAAIRRDAIIGGSSPEIMIGEAPLGRESLAAIRHEIHGSPAPEITLGQATLGRESLAAIDRADIEADREKKRPASSPDAVRVELVSMPEVEINSGDRVTLPWVEAAPDAKRAADAARMGRKLAPPRVTIKLDDLDPGEIEALGASTRRT